ncbi:MAG: hypothetical protein MJ025_06570 [Victivallaceae bacterium]|nr:hypothetical protein [Victivallaceae bacterium]
MNKQVKTALASLLISLLGATAAESVSAPEKDRPLITIRLSLGETEPDTWKDLFGVFRRNPGLCDEVWFSVTGDNQIDTPDTHRARSANMAKAAGDLREIGVIPSLHLERTIGYSAGIPDDNPGFDWGSYVDADGREAVYVSCPRQGKFHRYLHELGNIYGEWKPGSVWLDDDVRLDHHSPAMAEGGCHCDFCIAEFSKLEKKSYSRESLVAAYRLDKKLYNRWYAFQLESIEMMPAALVRGLRERSPQTRFGLQHVVTKARAGVIKALHKVDGRRVGARPGGGTWFDHDPYMIINKAIKISYLLSGQPGYDMVGRISPEIEDCPRAFCCKTARGRKLESILYLALGGDSLTYLVHGPGIETIQWYEKNTFAPLAKETGDYRAYARCNEGTTASGVGVAKGLFKVWDLGLPMVGIPFASHSAGACCKMLKKEMIEQMDDAELQETLAGNLILDGAAVQEVNRRGFRDRIGGVTAESAPRRALEYCSNDPLNEGIAYHAYFSCSPYRYRLNLPERGGFHILSHYATGPEEIREKFGNYTMHDKKIVGVAAAILERTDGTRMAFIGYDGLQALEANSTRVIFLNRIADWVSHGKLPVMATEPTQMLLVPRIDSDGRLKTVAIVNPSIGHSAPFTLCMRKVPDEVKATILHFPGSGKIELPIVRSGEFASVTIPEFEGWDGAWLEIPSANRFQ